MRIRRADPADHQRVGELTVAAYQPFLDGENDTYIARLRDAPARDAQAELWVAVEEGGRVVGTVTTCPPGSPWREIAGTGESEFRMLAVAPEAQGRGVGRLLVSHVVSRAAQQGDRAVVMSSLAEMTAAHRVYHATGFVRVPERDWSPMPGVELIAFRRELSAEEQTPRASEVFLVGEQDTAAALGSGSLPVLATPRLLAWCEAATCAALEPRLPAGSTSVGTRIELEHRAASALGAEVEVTASEVFADGRLHRFTVAARHADGRVVATGEVTRVVVEAERFLSRL